MPQPSSSHLRARLLKTLKRKFQRRRSDPTTLFNRRAALETLEDRRMLAAFAEAGNQLTVDLNTANTSLAVRTLAGQTTSSLSQTDVTAPGDTVLPYNGTEAGSAFAASKAIDNQTGTKYAVRTPKFSQSTATQESGLEITPASGASVIGGLRLTTATDIDWRDPAAYKFEGKTAGGSYTLISQGDLSLPTDREQATTITFNNTTAYTSYRLSFPKLRHALERTMQIGEVELLPVVTTTGSSISLKLTGDTWSGTDSANMTGNGTDTLTVTAAGVATLSGGVKVEDSAANVRVAFNDSGATSYSTPILVTLDDAAAGAITFNGATQLTGTASLAASTSRNIVVSSGATVETVDGALTLNANQQTNATTGDFSGIAVAGTIQATGSGVVTLAGRAGRNSTVAALGGVKISGNGRVSGGTTGELSINGNAGSSSSVAQIGVFLLDTATITSSGAKVSVNGTGGEGPGQYNYGVGLDPGTQITAGGNAAINVVGTGGAGGSFHAGVALNGGIITSGGGNVSILGTGGGTGAATDGYGIWVVNSGKATAGGSGELSLRGTGGSGTGANNDGVRLSAGGTSTITSASGTITVSGKPGTSSGVGVVIENVISHTGSGNNTQIELAGDSIQMLNTGSVAAGAHTVFVHPLTPGKNIELGGAGSGGLNLTDVQLDQITAGKLKIGDPKSGEVKLTGNITRAAKTDLQIVSGHALNQRNFTIDLAGGQLTFPRIGAPNFTESGKELLIDLDRPGADLAIKHDGTNYVLTLPGSSWGGADSSHVKGNESSTLLVTPAGIAHFDSIRVTDSAKNTSVTFSDSGTNAFTDNFQITLDEAEAGTITFNGATSFAGAAELFATTSRDIVVSSGARVKTVDGGLTLRANQQSKKTVGDFSGIVVSGTVESTGKGNVSVAGYAGDKSTSSRLSGVKVDGGKISGGTSGELTVHGNTILTAGTTTATSASGSGAELFGVLVTGGGMITSTGASVDVEGKGSKGTGGSNAGIFVDANSTITAGGSGFVTVAGTGGASPSNKNAGVAVSGGTITSGGGGVSVTGGGGGSRAAAEANGVLVESNGTITAGGSGTIHVSGRGGPGTGTTNHGVLITGGAKVTSANGSVTVDGVPGKKTGTGIIVDSTVSHTGGGKDSGIALVSDTMDITTAGIIAAGNNTVLLKPRTPNTEWIVPGLGYTNFQDATAPNDIVTAIGGSDRQYEGPAKAIDNQISTKYLNDGGGASGLEIKLSSGPALVTGIRLTTANDVPDRDPASYLLEGKLPDGSYAKISEGTLSLPDARHSPGVVAFANTTPYDTYRLTFPTRKGSTGIMQISEVELLRDFKLPSDDAELDRVSAGTLRIGDIESGPLKVVADITRPSMTNLELLSSQSIDRAGKTIDTMGGYLRVNANRKITDGEPIDRGPFRFLTSGAFTNDTTSAPVQMGFIPTSGQTFVPLLELPGGVAISGDKFTTSGKVVGIAGSERRDLFAGTVGNDINQRLVIPFAALTSTGFAITTDQAITTQISSGYTSGEQRVFNDTFTPNQLRLTLPNGPSKTAEARVELNGLLGFAFLNGAGVRLDGSDRLLGNATGFVLSVNSTNFAVGAATVDSQNNPTPIVMRLEELAFQTTSVSAQYSAAERFKFAGTFSTTFDGGSLEAEFPFFSPTHQKRTNVKVKALTLTGLKLKPDELAGTVELGRTSQVVSIRGRTAVLSGGNVDLGTFGFGVDVDPSDSDTRVLGALTIYSHAYFSASSPLTRFAAVPKLFPGQSSKQYTYSIERLPNATNYDLQADFSSTEIRISGGEHSLKRLSQNPNLGEDLLEDHHTLKVVVESPQSNRTPIRIVNGELVELNLRVAEFNMRGASRSRDPSNEAAMKFQYRPTRFTPQGNDLRTVYDPVNDRLAISGRGGVETADYFGSVDFGDSGLVLDGKDYRQSQLSIGLIPVVGRNLSFVGDSFTLEGKALEPFITISGSARVATGEGYGNRPQFSVTPYSSNNGRLQALVARDVTFWVNGTKLTFGAISFDFVEVRNRFTNFNLFDIGKTVADSFSFAVDGQTVVANRANSNEAIFAKYDYSTNRYDSQNVVASAFPFSGFSVDSPEATVEFGHPSKVTFRRTTTLRIGDVRAEVRGTLTVNQQADGLTYSRPYNTSPTPVVRFVLDQPVTIQDIDFAPGDLIATYDENSKRATFAGSGRYLGLAPVTIGGDPKNPQLVGERGVFKLTNFKPPVVDVEAGGIFIPAKGLTSTNGTASDGSPTQTLTGSKTIPVGGTLIKLELGGGNTNGIVINTKTRQVIEISATISGTFTVGGAQIEASGTLKYDVPNKQFEITGAATFNFRVSTGPVSLTINLGDDTNPGLIIKDGQVTNIQASVTASFKLYGIDVDVQNLGIKYKREKQEYGLFGSVKLSTAPVGGQRLLDQFGVELGAGPDSPGIVIKQGELESLDIAMAGTINLYGISATPENLRLKYSRKTNILALTGGLEVVVANKFRAKAAFPGHGLEINLSTGRVELKGLHLSVGDIKFGVLEIRNLEFNYEVDDKGNTTISGAGELGLPGGLTVGASLTIKNNRLSRVWFKVERTPGVPIGHPPVVYLTGIEGELGNLDDLENFSIRATVRGSLGPSVKIFGQTRALVKVEGTIFINKERLEISGNVQLLEGVFGHGNGKITVFFTGKEVVRVEANVSLYPGGIFKGDIQFTLDRNFNVFFRGRLAVRVPDGVPVVGGKAIGTIVVQLVIQPKKPRSESYVFLITYLGVSPFKVRFDAAVTFEGKIDGRIFAPGSNSKFKAFGPFTIPGVREFVVGEIDESVADAPELNLNINSITPIAGTPGAAIRYRAASEIPEGTTVSLYVDDDADGYDGHQIATNLPFLADEQTFTWEDLAAYAGVPYDADKPVYIYGAVENGTNFPIFTSYSDPIVPPDYNPSIQNPDREDYAPNQPVVFSQLTNNAIQVEDPLAEVLSDSQVSVELSAGHGTLSLSPENAVPWQNMDNPLDTNRDGSVANSDILQIVNLLNEPYILNATGTLPPIRSATSDAPMYDVNGDGLVTPLDALIAVNFVDLGLDPPESARPQSLDTNVEISGDGEGVLTLTGKAAEINALLDGLTYQPSENYFFDDSIDVSVSRYPGFYIETIDATIPIVAHPLMLGTSDGSSLLPVSYEQGSGHQAVLDTVMIHDAASGHIDGATIQIGNYEEGKDLLDLTLDDQMDLGVHATFDAHKGLLRLSGFASVEEYEQALHLIRFCSTSTGTKTLTITMGDIVNDRAELTQHVKIVSVNQAPTVNPGMGNIFEVGSAPVAALPSITVADPENETIAGATFAFNASTYQQGEDVLEFTDQNGITGQFDAATGALTLTGAATAADYTTALQSIRYKNIATSATTGVRDMTVTVTDGHSKNPETTVMERLLVVDSAVALMGPKVNNLPTSTLATPVDETPIVLAPELTLMDQDPVITTLMGAEVAIVENYIAGGDFLNVKGLPEGIDAEFDPFSGILHLHGVAPISYYEYALQQVTYSDHETVRDGLARRIEFSVHDGFTPGSSQSLTVQAQSLPVVEAGFGALVYTHGQKSEAVDPELIVEYMGGTTLTGATVEFVWGYMKDEDRLEFQDQNGITGSYDLEHGMLTLTGTASVADYQAALRSVTYHNTRVNPISGYREVEFHVMDGNMVSDQGDLLLANFLIDVVTDYMPPEITMEAVGHTFVENSEPLIVAPAFSVTDRDTPLDDGTGMIYLDGATVHVDGYVEGEDFVNFTPSGGITGEFDTNQGTLFLVGHATLENYQNVIRSVTYQNISEAPTTELRDITITLQQGATDEAASPITIEVQSLNNPPTRTSAAPADVTTIQNIASTSLGIANVTYDPPSEKEPDLVFTVDIVPDRSFGHVEFDGGVIAEVGETYSLEQFHSAVFVPALNATGDDQFVYTVAGFNPILQEPDPAHLIESVDIHVIGVDTNSPSEAYAAQVYRDLLGRNPTRDELDNLLPELTDSATRETFIDGMLARTDVESRAIELMFRRLLGREAAPGEIDALYIPEFVLNEDFSGDELPESLLGTDENAISVSEGLVKFAGPRNYVRTALGEYAVHDFTAEVTVTVGSDTSAAPEDQVIYFGMGSGLPDAAESNEPVDTEFVGLRLAPTGFTLDGTNTADVKDEDMIVQTFEMGGGSGTHRLRLVWDADTESGVFSIDKDYVGGDFVADLTFDPIDGADNFFGVDESRIFFGGAGNTTFDNLTITGDPLDLQLDEVQTQILTSDEYYLERGFGTHEGFVEALYEDLLDRGVTEEELAKHVDELILGGADTELANTLQFSNEGATYAVDQLYEELLRRPGDLFELVDNARVLQSQGKPTVVTSLLASEEYFTRYGTNADARSWEEIEQELILQWLLGDATLGNSVATNDFEAVGVIGDGYTGRGGGTLIGSEYVLTAAHLVAGHDIGELRFSVGATTYGVSEVAIHPNYNPSMIGTDEGHDIAVLRLNRPVVDVEPALLFRGTPETGAELTLVGFGVHPGDEQVGTKRVGTTPLEGVTPRLLTWTYDNAREATTVTGDSGSPQFIRDEGQYYVASVASGGTHQNLTLGDYAYNTRVDAYFEWIASVLGD